MIASRAPCRILGYSLSDQTVGNILRRFGIAPAPKRREQMNWTEFIRSHMAVLAGIDFFTVEVLTWRGLVTYYVLFFVHLETRKVTVAGVTRHPNEEWMVQMARNAVDVIDGPLLPVRFVVHDRDAKFCAPFRSVSQCALLQRHRTDSTTAPQSKPKRIRGTVRALHKGRVFVQTDPL